MDPLMALFSLLLTGSATAFLWLTWFEGRHTVPGLERSGPTLALDDLVSSSYALTPRSIRQTPLD